MKWRELGRTEILLILGMVIALFLLAIFAGCACKPCAQHKSHSCPEVGHGPCYLCDDPKYKVKYGRHNVLNH